MDKIITEIYEAFKAQGLTEQYLSEKTGIPQATLHRLITGGNKKLDLNKIRKIQQVLGLSEKVSDELKSSHTVAEPSSGPYSPEVRLAADYLEVKLKGKTAEERLKFVEEIMEGVRKKYR